MKWWFLRLFILVFSRGGGGNNDNKIIVCLHIVDWCWSLNWFCVALRLLRRTFNQLTKSMAASELWSARAQPQPKRNPMNDRTIVHKQSERTHVGPIGYSVVVWQRVQVMCGANETGRKSDEKRKWLLSCTAQNNNEKWRENWNVSFMRPRFCVHAIPIQFVWFWKKRNTKRAKNINSFRLHFSISFFF